AMAFAEGVAADDEGNRLLVVHRHAAERLADVLGCSQRIGVALGALGVDVDQAHLHGREGIVPLARCPIALVAEPGVLRAPEDLLGLPRIFAPESEAEGLETHRLQGAVAGKDDEVGPGDLAAVLLLDGPQQTAGLVEVGVVGPAVRRRESLFAAPTATPPVSDAVGAGRVPRHADEERPVVAVVSRPPVLRGGHHLEDVAPERLDIERLELFRVVEALAGGVGPGRGLMEHREVELVRPPVPIRPRPADGGLGRGKYGVLAFADAAGRILVRHGSSSCVPPVLVGAGGAGGRARSLGPGPAGNQISVSRCLYPRHMVLDKPRLRIYSLAEIDLSGEAHAP